MSLVVYLDHQSGKVNRKLASFLPKEKDHPAALSQAMRYAVLSGGKRIRPILTLAACEAVGGREKDVMDAACALELIHNYSLVHDDLPCMDDDDLRRGKPSCHVKYGEVTALLAGDALLTQAFKVLSAANAGSTAAQARRLQALNWIAEAVGSQGMVGGQCLDMEFQGKELDLPTIEFINMRKSGFLIAVSAKVGAYLGGGTPRQVEGLHRFGRYAGLLFQIVDDIMDRQGYAKVIGSHEAQEEASRLLSKAKRELDFLGPKAERLRRLTDFIVHRKN